MNESTLTNILGALGRPSAGRVSVDGHDLLKLVDQYADEVVLLKDD